MPHALMRMGEQDLELCLFPHGTDLLLGPVVPWALLGTEQGPCREGTPPSCPPARSWAGTLRTSQSSGRQEVQGLRHRGRQGLRQGSSLAGVACLGSWDGASVVTDDGRAAGVKALKNKRRGETPPNTQGLKPPKPKVGGNSSTTGAPRRPKEQRGALGQGRGATERFPAPADRHCCQAARWLQALSEEAVQQAPGEVLVASKHLNIA